MSFISYKLLPVSLNNFNFIADNIQLSQDVQLSPSYFFDDTVTHGTSPSKMWAGTLRLEYFLTGYDYLKQYIYSKSIEPISGNVGGLTFSQGYLSDYNLNIVPNEPIKVNASISFYDQLSGSLSAQTPVTNTGFVLRSSDIQINNLNGYTQNITSFLTKASVSYTCNIASEYVYYDSGITPTSADRVIPQERKLSFEISSAGLDSYLPLNGEQYGIILTFGNPSNTGAYETIGCSGLIYSKEVVVNKQSSHSHTIKIDQYFTDRNISLFSIYTGINFLVIQSSSGTFPFLSNDGSLSYLDKVFIGDTQLTGAQVFRTANYDYISGTQPFNVVDDILTVYTSYGNYVYPQKVHFAYPQISISGLSSQSGNAGTIVIISGQNFVRISDVYFGNFTDSNFNVIDPQTIAATIPVNGLSYPINVYSQQRNTSGNTVTFFYTPIITDINPKTGQWKDIISMTGSNFSGITGVYFNNSQAFSYSVINNNNITARSPETGNPFPYGYIEIYSSGGYGQSIPLYNPVVPIYSFTPSSAGTGDVVAIYTKIDTGYLCPSGLGYKVRVGTHDTAFYISGGNSTGILTGLTPFESFNDYIYIYLPDGVSTSASSTQLLIKPYIFINSVYRNPINEYQFSQLLLYGNYLSSFDNNSVFTISGWLSHNSQSYKSGTFVQSADARSLMISGFEVTGGTGYYDISINNTISTFKWTSGLLVNPPIPIQLSASAAITDSWNIASYAVDGSDDTAALIIADDYTPPSSAYLSVGLGFNPFTINTLNINESVPFLGLPQVNMAGQVFFISASWLLGKINIFTGNTSVFPAYTATNQTFNNWSVNFPPYGLSNVTEIRLYPVPGNAPTQYGYYPNGILAIGEVRVY